MAKNKTSVRSNKGSKNIIAPDTSIITPDMIKAMPPNFGRLESLLIAPRPIANDAPSILRLYSGWTAICISKVAETVNSLPLKLYVTKSTGSEKCVWNTKKLSQAEQKFIKKNSKSLKVKSAQEIEEVEEHNVFDVLNSVNDDMSWTDLIKMTIQYLLMIGNAYWQIRKDGQTPESIRILPAEYTMVLLNATDLMDIAGYRVYNGIREEVFNKEDVLHFKRISPGLFWRISSGELKTGIYGGGAAEQVLNEIMLYNAITDYERALMENMAIPSGVISYTEGTLTSAQIRDAEAQWKKTIGGLKRAGSIKVVDQNWTFTPLSINPKDLSYQEGRKWLRETIANACGVPLGLITPTESNRATSQTDLSNYMRFTIQPLCEMISDKINKLLIKHFDDNLFCCFEGVVKEDNEFLLAQEEQDIKYGVLTVNEVRAKRGLLPVEWGNSKYKIERETQSEDIKDVSGKNDKETQGEEDAGQ